MNEYETKPLREVVWGERFRDPENPTRWLTMWEGLIGRETGIVMAVSDKGRTVYRRMSGWQEVEVRPPTRANQREA